MTDRPTILRSRISLELVRYHPRGMSSNQVRLLLAPNATASEFREVLDAMVSDQILVVGQQARPAPHDPIQVYLASPALMRSGRNESQVMESRR